MMVRNLCLIGAPSSAGAYAPGAGEGPGYLPAAWAGPGIDAVRPARG
jgi:hypothetical protein